MTGFLFFIQSFRVYRTQLFFLSSNGFCSCISVLPDAVIEVCFSITLRGGGPVHWLRKQLAFHLVCMLSCSTEGKFNLSQPYTKMLYKRNEASNRPFSPALCAALKPPRATPPHSCFLGFRVYSLPGKGIEISHPSQKISSQLQTQPSITVLWAPHISPRFADGFGSARYFHSPEGPSRTPRTTAGEGVLSLLIHEKETKLTKTNNSNH